MFLVKPELSMNIITICQVSDCSRASHVRDTVFLPGTVVIVQEAYHPETRFDDEGKEKISRRT